MTYGNYGKLLVFKIGGDVELTQPSVVDRTIPEQTLSDMNQQDIGRGERLFGANCSVCHGLVARSGGVIKDLRFMGPEKHALFNQIVLEGILASNGMSAFDDLLSTEDTERVHEYVRRRAHEDREVALGNSDEARLTWLGD